MSELAVNGSFVATTADAVLFDDGYVFSTSESEPVIPSFTINTPISLQFRNNSGMIEGQSLAGLQVLPENTLALIGGENYFKRKQSISS